jgi:8-oxo-dGTP pyrophosphatase MutT (NUDIX family)
MKTFTKIIEKDKEPKTNKGKNTVYDGGEKGITVINENDYEFVSEPDTVMCVIYLVDRQELLLRKEPVPAYQHRDKETAFYLTCVSGQIEKDEKPVMAIVRELYEETGIRLNRSYSEFEYWGEFFLTKGNSMKTHMFYFPLFKDDYVLEKPNGDGSDIEKNSTNVRVGITEFDLIQPSDIPSAYMVNKFRMSENV